MCHGIWPIGTCRADITNNEPRDNSQVPSPGPGSAPRPADMRSRAQFRGSRTWCHFAGVYCWASSSLPGFTADEQFGTPGCSSALEIDSRMASSIRVPVFSRFLPCFNPFSHRNMNRLCPGSWLLLASSVAPAAMDQGTPARCCLCLLYPPSHLTVSGTQFEDLERVGWRRSQPPPSSTILSRLCYSWTVQVHPILAAILHLGPCPEQWPQAYHV